MTHVFVSYVREDREIVDRLTKELVARGITVWLDRHDLEVGIRWADAIKRAIQEGKFFMACFSKEYSKRSRTYMNEELTIAIDELRARPTDTAWFLPVLLDDTGIPQRAISKAEDLTSIQAVKLYEDWKQGIRRILRALGYSDPIAARIRNLTDMLNRPFEAEKLHAIAELSSLLDSKAAVKSSGIGPAVAEAIPALITALADGKGKVREAAVEALGKIGQTAVPALVDVLNNRDAASRCAATEALERIGSAAAESVPALTNALKSRATTVRWCAAAALGSIGPEAVDAVPALADALDDSSDKVRGAAYGALGRIGPAAVGALPALVSHLPNGGAFDALGKIGRKAMPALITALKSTDDYLVLQHALRALQEAGPAAAEAVPALIDTLKSTQEIVRVVAAEALGSIGPAAAQAVPALINALRDEPPVRDRDLHPRPHQYQLEPARVAAAEALGAIGPAAVEAVPALKEFADSWIDGLPYAVRGALRRIRSPAVQKS
jgi:HEAT repeat protein